MEGGRSEHPQRIGVAVRQLTCLRQLERIFGKEGRLSADMLYNGQFSFIGFALIIPSARFFACVNAALFLAVRIILANIMLINTYFFNQ